MVNHSIWYYVISTGNANSLTCEHLKSDLQSYFKPPDYAYQIQEALLCCKQSGNIASYIYIFLQYLNKCPDVEETEVIFHFVEGLVPEVECYIQLQQLRTLQQAVLVVK